MDFILNYLKDKTWTSPTQIGVAYGKSYVSASGWASPKCIKLVEEGKLERNAKGKYRLKVPNGI